MSTSSRIRKEILERWSKERKGVKRDPAIGRKIAATKALRPYKHSPETIQKIKKGIRLAKRCKMRKI